MHQFSKQEWAEGVQAVREAYYHRPPPSRSHRVTWGDVLAILALIAALCLVAGIFTLSYRYFLS